MVIASLQWCLSFLPPIGRVLCLPDADGIEDQPDEVLILASFLDFISKIKLCAQESLINERFHSDATSITVPGDCYTDFLCREESARIALERRADVPSHQTGDIPI